MTFPRTDLPMPASELRALFHYDRSTGAVLRKFKGRLIEPTKTNRGYLRFEICKRCIFVHRLVWFFEHGCLPNVELDHKDRVKTNNQIENLRLADPVKNAANRSVSFQNTSGFKGVTFHKSARKWQAVIKTGSKCEYLGLFVTPEAAHEAYMRALRIKAGEFARAA